MGAELCSLVNKATGIEHIWQADPAVWGKHAPILFPIVGELNAGKTLFNGETYGMSRHGFFRTSQTELVESTETTALFELKASPGTKALYPFDFSLRVGYELAGTTLINSFEVSNLGKKPMPFTLGGHPAFAIAYYEDESIDHYYLEFEMEEQAQKHLLNDEGLFNGSTQPVLEEQKTLAISNDLFNEDALVFKDLKSSSVQLKSTQHRHGLTFSFEDWPYLGIWAKPGAKYVCLEPWMGCADTVGFSGEFGEKECAVTLLPSESKRLSFSMELF